VAREKRFQDNCFSVLRRGSKEVSYLRLVDFVSLISRPRVIKKKKKEKRTREEASSRASQLWPEFHSRLLEPLS